MYDDSLNKKDRIYIYIRALLYSILIGYYLIYIIIGIEYSIYNLSFIISCSLFLILGINAVNNIVNIMGKKVRYIINFIALMVIAILIFIDYDIYHFNEFLLIKETPVIIYLTVFLIINRSSYWYKKD